MAVRFGSSIAAPQTAARCHTTVCDLQRWMGAQPTLTTELRPFFSLSPNPVDVPLLAASSHGRIGLGAKPTGIRRIRRVRGGGNQEEDGAADNVPSLPAGLWSASLTSSLRTGKVLISPCQSDRQARHASPGLSLGPRGDLDGLNSIAARWSFLQSLPPLFQAEYRMGGPLQGPTLRPMAQSWQWRATLCKGVSPSPCCIANTTQ